MSIPARTLFAGCVVALVAALPAHAQMATTANPIKPLSTAAPVRATTLDLTSLRKPSKRGVERSPARRPTPCPLGQVRRGGVCG